MAKTFGDKRNPIYTDLDRCPDCKQPIRAKNVLCPTCTSRY